MDSEKNNIINIRNKLNSLPPILEKVGTFIVNDPNCVTTNSITELAKLIDTSEASITRFCRSFGYKGFIDFKVALTLEQGATQKNEHQFDTDIEPLINNIIDTNKIINTELLNCAAFELHQANNIHILATGVASSIGLFFQVNLLRIGKQANFCEFNHAITHNFPNGANNLIVVIYNGECSADMLHSLAMAKQNGTKIITITQGTNNTLNRLSDWNLISATPSLNLDTSQPLIEIIGNLLLVDKLLQKLIEQDEKYQTNQKESNKSSFSIENIAAKLAELFMS